MNADVQAVFRKQNPANRECKFYQIYLSVDMFGAHVLNVSRGQIGSQPIEETESFESHEESLVEFFRRCKKRIGNRYKLIEIECAPDIKTSLNAFINETETKSSPVKSIPRCYEGLLEDFSTKLSKTGGDTRAALDILKLSERLDPKYLKRTRQLEEVPLFDESSHLGPAVDEMRNARLIENAMVELSRVLSNGEFLGKYERFNTDAVYSREKNSNVVLFRKGVSSIGHLDQMHIFEAFDYARMPFEVARKLVKSGIKRFGDLVRMDLTVLMRQGLSLYEAKVARDVVIFYYYVAQEDENITA